MPPVTPTLTTSFTTPPASSLFQELGVDTEPSNMVRAPTTAVL